MQAITDINAWVRPRNVRFWVLIVFLLYSVAGFLLVPWLLQRELPALSESLLQRKLTIGNIRLNPWTLALEAEEFELTDQDGSALVIFDRLRVNVQLSSLFRRALVLRELSLHSPTVNIVREGHVETNLGRVIETINGSADTASADVSESANRPRLFIDQFLVLDGVINLDDRVPKTPFHTQLAPINIEINKLSTLAGDEGKQVVRIQTEGGGGIEWTGTLQLAPLHLAGHVEIALPGLPLLTRYLDDTLALDLQGGYLDLRFDYRVVEQPDENLSVRVEGLDLNINETELFTEARFGNRAEPLMGFRDVKISGGNFRWPDALVTVDSIELRSPVVEVWRDPAGVLNLTQLLEVPADPKRSIQSENQDGAGVAGTVAMNGPDSEVFAAGEDTGAGRTSSDGSGSNEIESAIKPNEASDPVGSANVSQDTETAFVLGVDVSVAQLNIDGMKIGFEDRQLVERPRLETNILQFQLKNLSTKPDARAEFSLEADVTTGGHISASGDVGVFPVPRVNAAIDIEQVELDAAQPWVTTRARVRLEQGTLNGQTTVKSSESELCRVSGDLSVDGLLLHDPDGNPLVSWDRLLVQNANFELTANQFEIARLSLVKPFVHVEIDPERKLNFAELAVEQAKDAKDQADNDQNASLVFRMGRGLIDDGHVIFADLSLPLPFRTSIREFGGSISAMATDTGEPSTLNFSGRVGNYGQAKVSGQLIPFDPLRQSAVEVEFRNVNVPDLSPYSVQFAGRKVAAGKLNLDLNYRLDDAKLVGENAIVLEKFRLGEKVNSPGALDLPLGLAVALLSDSNGIIDLKIDIDGDVNNPKFSLGSIIRKALANLLAKAVSSPFKLLGGLVGGTGDTDLRRIVFKPGLAKLSPPQEEKLIRLGEALAQRPRLRLVVAGGFAENVDVPAIQEARIDALLDSRITDSDRGDALLSDQAKDVLEQLAAERLTELSLPALREEFTRPDNDPSTSDFDILAYLSELRQRLISTESVSQDDIEALGRARASAIAEFLNTRAGLPPERVARSEPVALEVTSEDDQIAISLSLEAA